eukprot:693832-Lingulodinium_polyedra.AAC.1
MAKTPPPPLLPAQDLPLAAVHAPRPARTCPPPAQASATQPTPAHAGPALGRAAGTATSAGEGARDM